MSHAHHQHENRRVLYFIENPVITNTNSISGLTALELFHAARPRVIGEPKNLSVYALQNVAGEAAKVPLGRASEFNSVDLGRHLPQPEIGSKLLIRNALIRLGKSDTHGLEIGSVFQRLQQLEVRSAHQRRDRLVVTSQHNALAPVLYAAHGFGEVVANSGHGNFAHGDRSSSLRRAI